MATKALMILGFGVGPHYSETVLQAHSKFTESFIHHPTPHHTHTHTHHHHYHIYTHMPPPPPPSPLFFIFFFFFMVSHAARFPHVPLSGGFFGSLLLCSSLPCLAAPSAKRNKGERECGRRAGAPGETRREKGEGGGSAIGP